MCRVRRGSRALRELSSRCYITPSRMQPLPSPAQPDVRTAKCRQTRRPHLSNGSILHLHLEFTACRSGHGCYMFTVLHLTQISLCETEQQSSTNPLAQPSSPPDDKHQWRGACIRGRVYDRSRQERKERRAPIMGNYSTVT